MSKTLGQVNYEGYNEVTEYKNFRGEPVPQYPDLPDKIINAWEMGAKRVIEATEMEAIKTVRATSVLEDFKALEARLESHKVLDKQHGREIAVAITNLQTARLWWQSTQAPPEPHEPQI